MLEGHLLSDRYRIKQTIGGGGMANVYLARDIILNRNVAIKVLRLEFANDPEFIERFDREAQAATSLVHPNIVNIYDVGEEDHILYIVMEYVEGLTLKEYIQQNRPLAVEEAVEIMKQLTDAIAHAHMNGLIHRDIKPQNVLIDKFGNVKVTDFGIAIALSATSLTQTNSIMGSVHYLSPEQARGGLATKKSDIYALGIVFYELLTGQLPFSGQSPISIALKHLQDDTPSIRKIHPHIPQSVENIVLKATAKDPFHRFQSAYLMEEALNKSLIPQYMHVAMYTPPVEEGEETKAIPIITDDHLRETDGENTLIHNERQPTKKMPSNYSGSPAGKKKLKKRFYKRKGFIFTILFLLLLAGGLMAYLLTAPGEVTIPDVSGKTFDEAVVELENKKLRVNKELMFSEDIPEGEVIKTDPLAGRKVKEKTTVDVFVSNGKAKIAFDSYVGKNFNQVKRILEEAGYKEIISYPKTSDAPIGEIITQISPKEGEEVVPSDTQVIFEISDGPEKISINQLIGMSLHDAKDYANKHGMKLNVDESHSDSVPKGNIISQNPPANTELTIGSTIHVVQSLGPEKLPPKSHKVTFTVPFQPGEDDEEDAEKAQSVQVYVEDMNHSITDVFDEEMITVDREYTLTLVIEPDKTAEYKVVRDGKVILNRTVKYGEGG